MSEPVAVSAPEVPSRRRTLARRILGTLRLCGLFGLVVGALVGLLLDLLRLVGEIHLADVPAVAIILGFAVWIVAAAIMLMLDNIAVIPNALASLGNALLVSALTSLLMTVLPAPFGVLTGAALGAVVGNTLCILCGCTDRKGLDRPDVTTLGTQAGAR